MNPTLSLSLTLVLAFVLTSPSAASAMSFPTLGIPAPAVGSGGKIQHVVIIVQENRSFDDLFQGYPGADTHNYGFDSNGKKITLTQMPLESDVDVGHSFSDFVAAYNNGRMNGFNNELSGGGGPDGMYAYVPRAEVQPYFNIAGQYVLADRMFTSQVDASFVSHQYIIAGQADHAVDFPGGGSWGCDGGQFNAVPVLLPNRTFGPAIPPCWDIPTLGDELDAAKKTWRFYTGGIQSDGGLWNAYDAINHIRNGPDWARDVINPPGQVLPDIRAGILSNVTWITPTIEDSDHAGYGYNRGPQWVTSLVNTIGRSKFWKSTAIFIFWDDWGGWYDHVQPPYLDYDGLGIRVPLMIVSPYAKSGYISHVQYEHGSILRFAEDQFGLGRLSFSDTRANSPAVDCFDFSQPPRPFKPFRQGVRDAEFERVPLDQRPPDDE